MNNIIRTVIVSLIAMTTCLGQNIGESFFDDANTFFQRYVKNGNVDYASLQKTGDIMPFIIEIEKADITGATENTKKAFYINAYNFHVINLALKSYPIESVQEIPGFFDKKKIIVSGEKLSLTGFEKKYLLEAYDDPRLHFVLVCGAVSCPPITDFAYMPNLLDEQLEQQTSNALNDPSFIRINNEKTEISQIFKWYTSDFGGGRDEVIQFINKYSNATIGNNVDYYPYDWTLNDTKLRGSLSSKANSAANNASRYIVSSTIPVGTYEIKLFNNLYTQKTGSAEELTDRSSFFTTTLTALYGLNNRLNIGINGRWRRVRNHNLPSSPFGVFGSDENGSTRTGVTGFGPMIRWAPVPQWQNFSIQSSYTFAIGDELTGNSEQPFIDWNGAVWNTQIFNDFPIGDYFSLFTEIDLLLEDLGINNEDEGAFFNNRTTTPMTAILSYNPNRKSTVYTLAGYAPTWSLTNDNGESGLNINDYFYQYGIGVKYQFTPNFEIELLYSDFTTKFLSDNNGQAATYNLGIRANL